MLRLWLLWLMHGAAGVRFTASRRPAPPTRRILPMREPPRAAADVAGAKEPSWSGAYPKVPPEEMDALEALYDATGGDQWAFNRGWSTLSTAKPSNPCGSPYWFGVRCIVVNDTVSRVTQLLLYHNGLVGTVPWAALAPLTKLEYLDFSNTQVPLPNGNNALTGPMELCALADGPGRPTGSFTNFSVAFNQMSGPLSPCIGSFPHLETFSAAGNNITGTTPDTVCNLNRLEELFLRGTALSGPIPDCIGKCSSLVTLDYSNINRDNSYPGPMRLSGTLPRSLCDLTALEDLYLQNTLSVTGPIPDCLGSSQPKLASVALQTNMLSGPVPEALCSVGPSLLYLLLYLNVITGTIPDCIGSSLTGLVWLQLGPTNAMRGPLPASLCNIGASLDTLVLGINAFTGGIPPCFGTDLPALELLEMNHNLLSSSLPESLCSLPSLLTLLLGNNLFTGEPPPCLGGLTTLTLLELQSNSFHGPLSEALCGLSKLQRMNIYNNSLSGILPPCLGQLSQLSVLGIDLNDFSGSLPNVCNLVGLTEIYAYSNSFTGTVPECYGSLTNLVHLELSVNDLSGAIISQHATPLRFCILSCTLIHASACVCRRISIYSCLVQGPSPSPFAVSERFGFLP